ncbi:hypothetical protein HPB47_006489 [Ixodes persulcatus]|uniref:Uncharacterized protein n=1 Tax=Ixodes persulcatus TaxID=34615 RepID=A0AC60PAM0_IXOPE|nr:hypothetical protein HPB47_006489 [Ixodes persulcatus]
MESSAPFRSKTKLLVAFLGMASVAFLLYQDYCQLPFTTPGTAALRHSHRPPAPDFNITANAAAATTTTQVRSIDSFRLNTTTRRDQAHEASSERREVVDVMLVFTRAREFRNLREKFSICLTSMFRHSSAPLHLHIVTDAPSQEVAKQVLVDASVGCAVSITVEFFDVNDVLEPFRDLVSYMHLHFSPKSGFYSNALFFLSLGLHRVLSLRRLILLDIDLRLESDVWLLHRHFALFPETALVGMAHEQQPTYLHLFHEHRKRHPETRCSLPLPRGNPGFNSGVLLLDLHRMAMSSAFQNLSSREGVEYLTSKYRFQGHLGDQDFYTVLSCERPELVYALPCTWNRQLCQWWKEHGYAHVFDDYHRCEGRVDIYHGNCNTSMPTAASGS